MPFSPKSPLLNPLLVRPGWETSTRRDERLLWLDKNENLDPELQELTARIFRELPPPSLATYPEFGALYGEVLESIREESLEHQNLGLARR